MLFLLAFIIIRANKEVKKPAPFVATIITPEEMQEKVPSGKPRPQEERPTRVPRLPRDLPPPKELSAVPSSPAPIRRSRPDDRPGKDVTANAGHSPSRGSAGPPQRQDEQGTAQERPRTNAKEGAGGDSSQPGRQFPSARTMREKLFDSEAIAKATREPKSKNDNAITFDTKEYKYYGYMQRLKEKIQGVWRYPAEAAQRKLNGELYIKFTIKKDGRLSAVELAHTSGYTILDEAAIRALRDADPYWPLPDSWNESSLTITGRFIYYFNNRYIR